MAVPKRKTSKARRDQRSSAKFIRPKIFVTCSNCSNPINSHQLCENCGFYKGRKIMKTKIERALKRNETKRAQQIKQMQAQQAAGQSSGQEG